MAVGIQRRYCPSCNVWSRRRWARERLSVYTLVYDDRFVSDPIAFQLRNTFSLLLRPRQLMTLFFVRGDPGSNSYAPGKSPAEQLLLAAVDSFLAQPPER